VEKYGTAGEATRDNTELAHCMLDNFGYKYTLRICNIKAAVVTRTRLTVTCIHELSVMLFMN